MKKVLFLLMMLMILGIVFSYAQCGKKQLITSSRTEYLDASGNLQRTVDESSTIEYNDSSILIVRSGGQQMKGTISSIECEWKVPYKEGKTFIKSLMTDDRGEARNMNITIEGKSETITFLAESPDRPDRKIRLAIEKFEEKK